MSGTVKFGGLLAKNVGPFEELDLDLLDRGLLLILGDNRDTTAADNNGSGKSHLLKGISWCLWGETPDGDKTDKLTKNGTDELYTQVWWNDDDGEWRVTRVKPRKGTATLTLEHNNTDVSAPTIAATQAEIGNRLGMDFATFRNTVLYAQGDIIRFADPATTDADRKLVLKRILRLDVLDKAVKVARSRLTTIEMSLSALLNEAGLVLAEIHGLEASADLADQLKEAEADAKQLQAKAARLPKLRELDNKVAEAIAEARNDPAQAEANKQMVDESTKAAARDAEARAAARMVEECKRKLEQLVQARADVDEDYDRELDEIKAFEEAGKCPSCGTETSAKSVQNHLAAEREEVELRFLHAQSGMDDEVEQATAALATQETLARELVASAQQHRKNAEAAKLRVQAAKLAQDAELAKWAPKQQEVRKEITLAEQAGVQAAAARRRADAIRQKMKGIDERKATLQARGVEIATESDKLKADKLHLEFWAKGFSNAGLPSHMMDAIMPALTDRANHYLGILADGDINISFDTQSKLKSGEAREKISINWIIEGEADTTPSGGQRKKISIAVDLALMDIVATRERASIDILLIDELLDGLDRTGRQRIMSLLSELRQQRSTILVISHDSDITELFENTLIVRKEARKAELLAV